MLSIRDTPFGKLWVMYPSRAIFSNLYNSFMTYRSAYAEMITSFILQPGIITYKAKVFPCDRWKGRQTLVVYFLLCHTNIPKHESCRVAYLPHRFSCLRENCWADGHVTPIFNRRCPKSKDVCTISGLLLLVLQTSV